MQAAINILHHVLFRFSKWYDMIWYDMIWYDMLWCDMWCGMIWYDVIQHLTAGAHSSIFEAPLTAFWALTLPGTPAPVTAFWGKCTLIPMANIMAYTKYFTRLPFGILFTSNRGGIANWKGGTQAFQYFVYIWAYSYHTVPYATVYNHTPGDNIWGSE